MDILDGVGVVRNRMIELIGRKGTVSRSALILPMLYSEGVLTGRITEEQFVAVTATNREWPDQSPARQR